MDPVIQAQGPVATRDGVHVSFWQSELSPFGLMITVDRAARLPETTEIRSALPASKSIQSQIAAVSSVRSLLRPHCFAELAAVGCGSPK
jgi:hypothetical protein